MIRAITFRALLPALALALLPAPLLADEPAAEGKKPELVAFVGGRVLTGSGRRFSPGVIVVEGGKIKAIGDAASIEVPEGARRIEVPKHAWLCPGMIAARSTKIGLVGKGDWNERYDRHQPQLELMQAIGVTAFYASDGMNPSRLSAGNAVIRIVRDRREQVAIKSGGAVELNLVATRPSKRTELRMAFDQAKAHVKALADYRAKTEAWKKELEAWRKREQARQAAAKKAAASSSAPVKEDKDANKKPEAPKDPRPKAPAKPTLRGNAELAYKVIAGEAALRSRADRKGQLRQLVSFCKAYGLRGIIIEGAAEGWTMPAALASVGAQVVVTPHARLDPRFSGDQESGWRIENAHRLHEAGVVVAVCTSSTGFDYSGLGGDGMLTFRIAPAFAVRGGMSNAQALSTVTHSAAKLLGVEAQIGSLAVGRHADIVVYDGDPLHYRSLVEQVYMGGRLQYERSQSTWFRHIKGRHQQK